MAQENKRITSNCIHKKWICRTDISNGSTARNKLKRPGLASAGLFRKEFLLPSAVRIDSLVRGLFTNLFRPRRRARLLRLGMKYAKQMVQDPSFSSEDVSAYLNFLLEIDLEKESNIPQPPPPPAEPRGERSLNPIADYNDMFCTRSIDLSNRYGRFTAETNREKDLVYRSVSPD